METVFHNIQNPDTGFAMVVTNQSFRWADPKSGTLDPIPIRQMSKVYQHDEGAFSTRYLLIVEYPVGLKTFSTTFHCRDEREELSFALEHLMITSRFDDNQESHEAPATTGTSREWVRERRFARLRT